MLEQQAREMPRRDDAASEPVDETLSVVRQLMAQEKPAPAPKPRTKPVTVGKVQKAAGTGATQAKPAGPGRREKPIKGRAALPELDAPATPQHVQEPEHQPETPRISLLHRLGALWPRRARDDEDETAQADANRAAQAVPGQRTLLQAIKEFRPTRKQIAFAVLIGIVLWRPWLIPGILFVSFWVALIAYLTLGPDRVSEIAQGRWQWFSARYPDRAERLLHRAQRGADRVDGWLARLPERWTDGIYLPDLGRSQAEAGPVEAQPDPFDRLAAEHQAMSAQGGRA